MNLNDALEAALIESDVPVITDYEFYRLGARVYADASWKGMPLSRLPSDWDHNRMRNAQRRLRARQVIAPDADFRMGMWRVVQSSRAGSAEEITSIADPFCYVSHLSAMERYGLTDRSPEALHLSTPWRLIWNTMRNERVLADGMTTPHVDAPSLVRFGFKEQVRRRRVIVHETRHPATPTTISGERTRITDVGRTFADMLDTPMLCGGMRHVLDIWANQALHWSDSIIAGVDSLDSKIAKVRAGYLFTERLGLEDERIKRWEEFAQRGGSRKLDPDSPYVPIFSERWMLSINA
jgi:predicted transcriptional regulator of viral defense system